MSEQSRASVEDDEVEAGSGPADSSNDEPGAASRVPARRERRSAPEGEDFADDEAASAKPTGKRARRRASSEDAADSGGRRPAKGSKEGKPKEGKKAKRAGAGRSRNPFAAVVRFLREVVAELAKVIWPQRRQMVSYTVIVIIFVAVVVSFVAGLDIGFAKLTLWLLG